MIKVMVNDSAVALAKRMNELGITKDTIVQLIYTGSRYTLFYYEQ